jgi:hypothetical protein
MVEGRFVDADVDFTCVDDESRSFTGSQVSGVVRIE